MLTCQFLGMQCHFRIHPDLRWPSLTFRQSFWKRSLHIFILVTRHKFDLNLKQVKIKKGWHMLAAKIMNWNPYILSLWVCHQALVILVKKKYCPQYFDMRINRQVCRWFENVELNLHTTENVLFITLLPAKYCDKSL